MLLRLLVACVKGGCVVVCCLGFRCLNCMCWVGLSLGFGFSCYYHGFVVL